MGMLRTIVIVGAGLALMPSPPPGETDQPAETGPGAFAYAAAAMETVADMRGFCQRNPNACEAAGAAGRVIEGKARYSAKLVYEWANEVKGETVAEKSAELRGTLTEADLKPEWKKPKPLKAKG